MRRPARRNRERGKPRVEAPDASRPARGPFLWIAGLCAAAELAFWALALLPEGAHLRSWAAQYLGFWPGLLGNWQSNFRLQPVTMFATYWVIHAGPLHLLGNLAVLVWLEARLASRFAAREIWEIWIASVLGGAIAFGLLEARLPMIGASGGIFGLLGAVMVLHHHDESRHPAGMRRAIGRTALACLGLVALSLVDYLLRHGALAWQSHLGGFLAGAAMAAAHGFRRDDGLRR